MGIYALARKEEITIRSRTNGQERAWQVHLSEQHFTGAKAAPVTLLDEPTDIGTTVSFRDPDAKEDYVKSAARHYPLPVRLNGYRILQTDFLKNCANIEEWQGLRIGITSEKNRHRYHPKLNFHGITLVDQSISSIATEDITWAALVDVVDCPALEPTLPTRRSLVQNDFLKELSRICRAAIYRAILNWGTPIDISKELQDDAASMGIAMPGARPLLLPWEPEEADPEPTYRERVERRGVSCNALIMDAKLEPADQQSLFRALKRNNASERVYAANNRMQGYKWYDQIPAIHRATTSFTNSAGETLDLATARRQEKNTPSNRPESITITLGIAEPFGKDHEIVLPADVAFLSEDLMWMPAKDTPLLTQDSDITPPDLTDLMVKALFHPSDNIEDSYNIQKDDAWNYLNTLSITTLVSKQESIKTAVAKAADTHLRHEVPAGWEATVRITRDRKVVVDISPAAPEEQQKEEKRT